MIGITSIYMWVILEGFMQSFYDRIIKKILVNVFYQLWKASVVLMF